MDNKTKIFKFRLTEKQDKILREAAAKAKLTPTEYARRKIFTGEVGVMDSLKFLQEYGRYNYEIDKIGNNINQLAHYANILLKNDQYSKDVIDEMTIQLLKLTSIEMKVESLVAKILRV